jgi:ubiquinone biosynthesis protein COQ4
MNQTAAVAAAAAIPFYGSARRSSRLILTLRHAIVALQDPTRADAVAAVGELTGVDALRQLATHMRSHPVGRQILLDRPLITKQTIPYDALIKQAESIKNERSNADPRGRLDDDNESITFGQAYGLYLHEHGFDPDARDQVRYLEEDSTDEAYVMTRYRQCHDFWHALTGLPPTVAGELGLKWLELFQTGLPLCAFSCCAAVWRLPATERRLVWDVYLPWARRAHRRLGDGVLLNVYYEKEFDTNLRELRERLNLEPAPVSTVV